MSTRGVSSPIEPRWLQLLCLSLVVMRCQPLRRALCANSHLSLRFIDRMDILRW
ncbi:exlusion protein FxsA [Vibrio cholerae]|nr:exlusion protein FxsA [Vibrio cholerae]